MPQVFEKPTEDAAVSGSAPRLTLLIPKQQSGLHLRVMIRVLDVTVKHTHEIVIMLREDEAFDESCLPVTRKYCQSVRIIRHQHRSNLVGIFNQGVNASRGDYVLILAADEVGPILAIEDMVDLMDEGCDLVSFTRYAHGGMRLGGSLSARILSRWANRTYSWLSGSGMTDFTTGLKLIRRSRYSELNLMARPIGWAPAFELSIKSRLAGWVIGEVPVISIDRFYGGRSEYRLLTWTWEYLQWYIWGVYQLRRYRRRCDNAVRVRQPKVMQAG